jgi:hypothetical protein
MQYEPFVLIRSMKNFPMTRNCVSEVSHPKILHTPCKTDALYNVCNIYFAGGTGKPKIPSALRTIVKIKTSQITRVEFSFFWPNIQ